ncbi:MAG: LytTR family DNA-binding domain-containing protein [Bacteroidetes bacterium]|nr:LytTR family DNA-binding domain-containing protein [Bacteroidota bacterium]
MINAVIIDDEPFHSNHLKKLLTEYCPEVSIIKEISSGKKAIKDLAKQDFDLVFFDVMLGDMTAFDVLKQIADYRFHIIFITAYDDFAINAFKVNAIDYLLKPIEGKNLQKAVEKAMKQIFSENEKHNLLFDFNLSKSKCICISESNSYTFIPCTSIQYCKSSGNYTEIFYEESGVQQKVLATKNLLYFEKKLLNYQFIRIHQSVLVNRENIRKIIKKTGELILNNEMKFEIARNRKNAILKLLIE